MTTMKERTVWQLLTDAGLRRIFTYLAAGLLTAAAVFLLGHEIRLHVETIEAWIRNLGLWGLVAFVVLFVLATSLLVPESVLSIMAGALFGLKWGIPAVVVGNLLAASLQYGLSRKVLRKHIDRLIASRPSLVAIQRAAGGDKLGMQALVRLTPVNPATLSYLFGAVGVRFSGFLLACLAFVPHMVLEVYFGYAAKHATRMAVRTTHGVYAHDIAVFGGLTLTAMVMVIVSKKARQAVMQSVSETEQRPGLR
jgi:uncharacterized membrane protein YdjX (TVP38/TMEM64 family)